jgi:hypothetical protein
MSCKCGSDGRFRQTENLRSLIHLLINSHPREIWQQLVGIAKFLSRTGQSATLAQLQEKLDLSDRTLHLGLNALSHLGFQVQHLDWAIAISWHPPLLLR